MSRSYIWRRASLIGILVVILAAFTASAKPSIPISFDISEDPFPVIPVSRGGKQTAEVGRRRDPGQTERTQVSVGG